MVSLHTSDPFLSDQLIGLWLNKSDLGIFAHPKTTKALKRGGGLVLADPIITRTTSWKLAFSSGICRDFAGYNEITFGYKV